MTLYALTTPDPGQATQADLESLPPSVKRNLEWMEAQKELTECGAWLVNAGFTLLDAGHNGRGRWGCFGPYLEISPSPKAHYLLEAANVRRQNMPGLGNSRTWVARRFGVSIFWDEKE